MYSLYSYQSKIKAFTLIEILIVITIMAILATVTLDLNRSRISEMQSLNERELRRDQHNHLNRELTNTNYMNGKKVSSMIFHYANGTSTITASGFDNNDIELFAISTPLHYHTISGSLSLQKTPLSLGCTILDTNGSNTNSGILYLIDTKSKKSFCFQANSSLCSRSKCQ